MPSDELVQAIRLAHRSYTQMLLELIEKLMASQSEAEVSKPCSPNLESLTPREQDVLRLIRDSSTNREIAEQLFIAEGAVTTHVTY